MKERENKQQNKQKSEIEVVFELTKPQRQLVKGWIVLSSEQITTVWIGKAKTYYPVDSAVHLLNIRDMAGLLL